MDDANVGPAMPFVTHYYGQEYLEPKPRLLINECVASDARPEGHLLPRNFETPNKRFAVRFGGKQSEASEERSEIGGAYIDLRFFVPIVVIVLFVAALPLLCYYSLRYSLSGVWQSYFYGYYDCT